MVRAAAVADQVVQQILATLAVIQLDRRQAVVAAAGQARVAIVWKIRAEFAAAVELAGQQTGSDFAQRKAEVEHCQAGLS